MKKCGWVGGDEVRREDGEVKGIVINDRNKKKRKPED